MKQLKNFITNPESKIWYLVALAINVSIISFLIYNINQNVHLVKSPFEGLFLSEGDTGTYYGPLEDIIQGKGYTSVCRMPALLPIYLILRMFLSVFWTKNIIVVLQVITNSIAAVLISKIAYKFSSKLFVFYSTLILYTTCFLLNKETYFGYMDSLAVSTLVIGYYFIICKEINWKNLLISGFFIGWSVFFRQVLGVNLFFVALYIFVLFLKNKQFKKAIQNSVVFILPFLVALIIWNGYSYSKHNYTPVLVKSGAKCWGGYPPHLQKVVKMVIGWGGNFTKWNGEAQWFITNYMSEAEFPFSEKVMTSEYNYDSLLVLRRDFLSTMYDTFDNYEVKDSLINSVSEKAIRYRVSYIKENPFKYYILNRFVLLRKFTIPNQIDGLILPPLNEMNIVQKAAKTYWWGTFALFNVLGIIGFFVFMIKNRCKDFLLHFSFLSGFFYLVFISGLIEQRYIAPYLPFIFIYASYLLYLFKKRIDKVRK